MPHKPSAPCPICRRHNCNTPTHKQKAGRFKKGGAAKTWRETQRRKAAVNRHLATKGQWCPGYNTPPHKATDLTADHITPVTAGGHEQNELQVLCRSCNSRKHNQTR